MNKLYLSPSQRFSFEYPSTCRLRDLSAGSDFLILDGSHPDETLQISGMPFDDDLPLTFDRIQSMFPAIRIDEPVRRRIGHKTTIDALYFLSSRQHASITREIWFARRDRLFQISASLAAQALLDEVIATWVFDPSPR